MLCGSPTWATGETRQLSLLLEEDTLWTTALRMSQGHPLEHEVFHTVLDVCNLKGRHLYTTWDMVLELRLWCSTTRHERA